MKKSEHDLDGPPRTDVSFSDCDGNRVLLFEIYRETDRSLRSSKGPA